MIRHEAETLVTQMVATVADKAILIDGLAVLKDLVYQKDMKQLKQKLQKRVPERFYVLLEMLFTQAENPIELSSTIVELEKFINSLPVVHITLSYDPTKEQLSQLATRLQSVLEKPVILDYETDYSIGLGVTIHYQGTVYKKTITDQLGS